MPTDPVAETTLHVDRRRGPYRPRVVHTCTRCRDLKVRCDRALPCGGCAGARVQCSLFPAAGRVSNASPTTESGPGHCEEPMRRDQAPKRVKRPRVSLSCTRCRRLKQRCDTRLPCAGCMRGNVRDLCEYDSGLRARKGREHFQDRERDWATSGDGTVWRRQQPPTCSQPPERMETGSDLVRAAALPAVGDPLAELLPLLPSGALATKLRREFELFDVMFRFVHQPSFQRRSSAALQAVPSATLADVPFLAMICAAFLCTSTVSTEPAIAALERPLRALTECLLWLCEDAAYYTIDYVHALLLMCAAHLGGGTSSPAKMFLALGRAYHAAILVGVHLDQEGEGVFEREIRRRVWCHITMQRDLMADKVHLYSNPDTHGVPRPLVISDDELEALALNLPPVRREWAEWTHLDAKADVIAVLVRKRGLMRDESIPLLQRLMRAEELIADYAASIPPQAGARPADTPHWAWMQSYLLGLWSHDTVVQLYHPYFGSLDAEISSHALVKGLDAAHRLVEVTKALLSFLLFDYVDAPSAALWTYTMKSFTAGLVMAYALLSDPEAEGAPRHAAALDAMVGALRSCLPMGGSTTSNRQALAILENLRAKIRGGTVEEVELVAGVTDPYTAKSYALPFTLPSIQSILPGEWVEWEALFRDLLDPGIS